MPQLIVAGSKREYLRHSQKQSYAVLKVQPRFQAAKLDSGPSHKVNNDRDEKNRSKKSAANNHDDLQCLQPPGLDLTRIVVSVRWRTRSSFRTVKLLGAYVPATLIA
jgi:hypothetical protein